jgi:hypothetical protein
VKHSEDESSVGGVWLNVDVGGASGCGGDEGWVLKHDGVSGPVWDVVDGELTLGVGGGETLEGLRAVVGEQDGGFSDGLVG